MNQIPMKLSKVKSKVFVNKFRVYALCVVMTVTGQKKEIMAKIESFFSLYNNFGIVSDMYDIVLIRFISVRNPIIYTQVDFIAPFKASNDSSQDLKFNSARKLKGMTE